jgi:hypothetical protein
MAQYMTGAQKAGAATPDYPACAKTAPPIPPGVRNKKHFHILASILLPAGDRFVLQQYRVLTDRRLAATVPRRHQSIGDRRRRAPDAGEAVGEGEGRRGGGGGMKARMENRGWRMAEDVCASGSCNTASVN